MPNPKSSCVKMLTGSISTSRQMTRRCRFRSVWHATRPVTQKLRMRAGCVLLLGLCTYPLFCAAQAQDAVDAAAAPLASEASQSTPKSLFPFLISLGTHLGYDSNSQTQASGSGSFFVSQGLTLNYDRTQQATQLALIAGLSVVDRFDRGKDANAFLSLSAGWRPTRRLSLSATLDTAYRNEPDFSSDVGPSQRKGNYFQLTNGLAATYQWAHRFSTTNSVSFRTVQYANEAVSSFTNREEYTLGQGFQFVLNRQTALLANYRFLLADYDSAPLDSTTHFVLVGAEEEFSRRLKGQLQAGLSFRSFDQGGEQTDPTVISSLEYAVNRVSNLKWTARYGVEAPAVKDAILRKTFRTGSELTYGFTPRITSALALFYHHDENERGFVSNPLQVPADLRFRPTTDALDVSVSGRYQVSDHIDVDVSFEHSNVFNGSAAADYSRSRYGMGLTVTF